MKTTRFLNSSLENRNSFSETETFTKNSNIIMASKNEVISIIEMMFHNVNIAMLMLSIDKQRYYSCEDQLEMSLDMAITKASSFAMSDIFKNDEERLEYLRVVLPAIRGFYADGFRLIVNPNWDNK